MSLARQARAALSVLVFATAAAAQGTTGVVGINDLTLGDGSVVCTSGSTSCTPCNFVCPPILSFDVSCAPFAPVAIYLSPCPCFADWACLGSTTCPVPMTACGNTQNQSVDLNLTCSVYELAFGYANGLGLSSVVIPVPPGLCGSGLTITFAVQAVVLDFACFSTTLPFHLLLTQAYDVTITL
jgi:hypothetical protein